MKPLRPGAARSGLQEGLSNLAHHKRYQSVKDSVADGELVTIATVQAAVLGGAVEQALQDLHPGWTSQQHKEYARDFWRLANENLWRLTRTLEASGTLNKAGE